MIGPDTCVSFVADRGDERLRLDQAVLRRLRDVTPRSRNRVQTWIADGRITVDERLATRAAARLRLGMTVVVRLPDDVRQRQAPLPEAQALDIVFEDTSLVVVNKPAGLVVHPSYKQTSGTLLNAVLAHVPSLASTPGIVTRLDKHTSGLVVIAIAPDIHRIVQADVRAGSVTKEYLAIVEGEPAEPHGTITLPLGRDPLDRRRVCVDALGVSASTRYHVLAMADERCLVRCELLTGRTHQIRVHMAAIGCALVGDAVYGRRDPQLGARQALHAWRVVLPHPVTREPLEITAPPPPDFERAAGPLMASVARTAPRTRA